MPARLAGAMLGIQNRLCQPPVRQWQAGQRENGGEGCMDEELIWWCVMATRAACVRMTARHLKGLEDSVGQACCLPARFAWDHRAAAHVQVFDLLADVAADHPVPALVLAEAVGTMYDLMVAVGPAADGMI